jgi:hypothetical protein
MPHQDALGPQPDWRGAGDIRESGPPQRQKDARTIGQSKRAGGASTALSYEFARPHAEPLLWILDALDAQMPGVLSFPAVNPGTTSSKRTMLTQPG